MAIGGGQAECGKEQSGDGGGGGNGAGKLQREDAECAGDRGKGTDEAGCAGRFCFAAEVRAKDDGEDWNEREDCDAGCGGDPCRGERDEHGGDGKEAEADGDRAPQLTAARPACAADGGACGSGDGEQEEAYGFASEAGFVAGLGAREGVGKEVGTERIDGPEKREQEQYGDWQPVPFRLNGRFRHGFDENTAAWSGCHETARRD